MLDTHQLLSATASATQSCIDCRSTNLAHRSLLQSLGIKSCNHPLFKNGPKKIGQHDTYSGWKKRILDGKAPMLARRSKISFMTVFLETVAAQPLQHPDRMRFILDTFTRRLDSAVNQSRRTLRRTLLLAARRSAVLLCGRHLSAGRCWPCLR